MNERLFYRLYNKKAAKIIFYSFFYCTFASAIGLLPLPAAAGMVCA